MNYSELLQLAKGWGNFISGRIIIWRLLFIADRGYETYNIFAHVQEKGMYYLIRVKDGGGGSMTGSFDLPDENEFDHDMQLILTRKQTKDVKAKPQKFKFIAKSSPFDYLDLYDKNFIR